MLQVHLQDVLLKWHDTHIAAYYLSHFHFVYFVSFCSILIFAYIHVVVFVDMASLDIVDLEVLRFLEYGAVVSFETSEGAW